MNSGDISGIVITITLVVAFIAVELVYYFQRFKIDKLKNKLLTNTSSLLNIVFYLFFTNISKSV